MSTKTFIIEWDPEDLLSTADALIFGVPGLKQQVERDMKNLLDGMNGGGINDILR